MLSRKRKRTYSVKLNNRLGSRRTRALIALALLLIAGGLYLNNVNQTSTTRYVIAASDLAPGMQLNPERLATIEANMGEKGVLYLTDQDRVSDWFIDRGIKSGELIPKSVLVSKSPDSCRTIRLGLSVGLATEIAVGDSLDVWAGQQNSASKEIPEEIVSGASLIAMEKSSDALSQVAETIEICVPIAQIRSVVNAIALREVIVAVKSQ